MLDKISESDLSLAETVSIAANPAPSCEEEGWLGVSEDMGTERNPQLHNGHQPLDTTHASA